MDEGHEKEYTRRTITEWGRRLPLTPGGYAETVDCEWKEGADTTRTLVTQARLAYVFCHCSRLGNKELKMLADAELAKLAVESTRRMMSVFWRPELRGWIRTADKNGNPLDATIDSYGQSFGLFALALDYRVRNNPETHDTALQVLAALDEYAAAPRGGGYLEFRPGGNAAPGLPFPKCRRQDPHMHLFEAFLAWHRVDRGGPWAERARAILDLLCGKFHQPDGSLAAYFDEDLNVAAGRAGEIRVVGDHYEWAWLLGQYEKFTGDSSMRKSAERLYAFAEKYGKDKDGLAFSSVDSGGRVLDGNKLLWMQLEMLKGQIAFYDWTAEAEALRRAENTAGLILERYLHDGVLFYNKLDADGKPDPSPTLSRLLYHVFMASCEAERVLWSRPGGEQNAGKDTY
ncbi:MAG: AGE family epimerase/isomerase [Spirochaetia bacterium]|jgi:mannose-6-phosphate isomerase|nr:AGE family epimerase/isomerase [Spirochaetia bacterium]